MRKSKGQNLRQAGLRGWGWGGGIWGGQRKVRAHPHLWPRRWHRRLLMDWHQRSWLALGAWGCGDPPDTDVEQPEVKDRVAGGWSTPHWLGCPRSRSAWCR